MVPIITLIGRPNVGKSTLFNRLTRTKDALVADFPGLTRDRKYGHAKILECEFICIDTSGIDNTIQGNLSSTILKQSKIAIEEADVVLFLVDARTGLLPEDIIISQYLRVSKKITFIVANKIEGLDTESALSDFWSLGLGKPYPIDASHGRGISNLMELILLPWINKNSDKKQTQQTRSIPVTELINQQKKLAKKNQNNDDTEGSHHLQNTCLLSIDTAIKIAIVGQPNVGKSTLTNCILGKDRVIVSDIPGTTRDTIDIKIERDAHQYILIDTAGVRQRKKITEKIEKFSVIKTLQAIKNSHVVMLVLDAKKTISDQDMSLLSFILNSGRSLIIILNKSDGLVKPTRDKIKQTINHRMGFINFIRIHFVSALHGSGINNLFKSVIEAYDCATRRIHTSKLTNIMHQATKEHQPPLIHTRRIKLKYAHAGGYNPIIIIIHGNKVKYITDCYKRYLINYFRRSLGLVGALIQIQFKEGKNPYIDTSKVLTYKNLRKIKN
ncbi:GTPase Der [Candidatus Erwinia haradaeae]|uniref:GTPase Der n=1 Tax=Candidatus Erwinia haradaeae TaxID=1922217 RepID=A0A451D2W6_9GAMM|nr:ribosome biogenesis GTPase Der [Candidatus Erwinia haradaeae]VFP79979.1 GTPase Der [Candidatus Erwinia haradaeae]